jgi:hypothetical protein
MPLTKPWPLEIPSATDPDRWSRAWAELLMDRRHVGTARVLMETVGVPEGVVDATGRPLADILLGRMGHEYGPARDARGVDRNTGAFHGQDDEEQLLAALLQVNPLSPVAMVGFQADMTMVQALLHSGADRVLASLVSHPQFPPPAVWQGWQSEFSSDDTGKNKLPWLHFLASTSRMELLDLLLSCPGVDPNQKDKLGRTALFYARSTRAVMALVKAGVDPAVQGKDGRNLVSSWAFMGVSEDLIGDWSARIPALASDPEGMLLSKVVHTLTRSLTSITHWSGGKHVGLQLPDIDWQAWGTRTMPLPVGPVTRDALMINHIVLGVTGTKGTTEQERMVEGLDPSHAWMHALGMSAFSRLLPHVPVDADGSALPAALYLAHTFCVEDLRNPGEHSLRWYRHHNLSPELFAPLVDWADRWEKSLGATPQEALVSVVGRMAPWIPAFNRSGAARRNLIEKETHHRLRALPRRALQDMWEDPGLESFWVKALRSPMVTPIVLPALLESGSLPMDRATSRMVSALYSACVTAALVAPGRQSNQLRDLLDQQHPWLAENDDIRHARPNSPVRELDDGARIQAMLSKTRLEKKLAAVAVPDEATAVLPKRRL